MVLASDAPGGTGQARSSEGLSQRLALRALCGTWTSLAGASAWRPRWGQDTPTPGPGAHAGRQGPRWPRGSRPPGRAPSTWPESAAVPGPARPAAGPPGAGPGTRRAAAALPPAPGGPASGGPCLWDRAVSCCWGPPGPHPTCSWRRAGQGFRVHPGSPGKELPPTGACPAQEAPRTVGAPWGVTAGVGRSCRQGPRASPSLLRSSRSWGSAGPRASAEARNTFSRTGSSDSATAGGQRGQ